ncbi:MAG: lactate utilization protein [Kiritimatiellia bacterium]|jgi:hypothetical protein
MKEKTITTLARLSECKCRRTVDALNRRGFAARYCATAAEAADAVVELGADAKTVGLGGSLSVGVLGVRERLAANGAEILDHSAPDATLEERVAIMRAQQTCDLFICSVNAVTAAGEIVNVDGTGNRVAASFFGPAKIVLVAGRNKIVEGGVAEAIQRVKNVAAPGNAIRLSRNTPCARTGVCSDCDSPERICRITVILDRKPSLSDITVLVVDEDLGL